MKGWEWNAMLSVQEEFRAKRGKVFALRPKAEEDLSFRFVIGTAVRDCAQMKNVLQLCASPQAYAMITS